MNTVLLLDQSFKLSCKIADTLFQNDINVFRLASEEQCVLEANRLKPVGIIVAISDKRNAQKLFLDRLVRDRNVPVVVVSESHDEAEELAALDMGVAAFLDGNASCELIAARIVHALNISSLDKSGRRKIEEPRMLKHHHLELDLDAHCAKWRGQELEVTCTEMSLLVALIQRPGIVKSRCSLIDEAYAENIHVDERTIDSHMKRIRAKFRELDSNFDGIQSVYGVGYRFRVPRKTASDMTKSAQATPGAGLNRHEAPRTRLSQRPYADLALLAT